MLTLVVLLILALLVHESLPEVTAKAHGRGTSPLPLIKLRGALSDAPFVALLAAGFLLYYVFVQIQNCKLQGVHEGLQLPRLAR